MAKQLRIANTGRPGIPEVLEEASEDLLGLRRDKRRIMKEQNDKVRTGEWKVLTLMQEHDVKKLAIKDPDTEEILSFDLEAVLRIRKTGEVGDGESGEEVTPKAPSSPDVHPGLIAMAEQAKAQADANVEETGDGDITVPDTAAPKAKRGKKAKKS
jgi:hypothetical protein